MIIQLDKFKVLAEKTDKNNKQYKPCVIESSSLKFPYWRNIYKADDPTLNWKEGTAVDLEIEDSADGKWHNFLPSGYEPKKEQKAAQTRTDNKFREELMGMITEIQAQLVIIDMKLDSLKAEQQKKGVPF